MPGDDGGKVIFEDRKAFDQHLVPYIGHDHMELIVRPARKERSRQEEKYYHGVVCQKVAEAMGITRMEAHKFLASMFLRMEEKVVLPGGKTIRYWRVMSTTELNDKRYDEYIFQEIIPWAALATADEGLGPDSGLGLYIPLPNEVDYSQIY